MGAWDYGALDNDPAKDILYRWGERVEKNGLSPDLALSLFFEQWGDAIRYGDAITNMEIVAVLAIYLNNDLTVPSKLKKASIDALNRELVPSALGAWGDPEKRRESLMSLLHKLGGKVSPPKRSLFFSDSALYFRNTDSAKQILLDLATEKAKTGKNGKSYPPFLGTLDRLMNYNVWEKDYKIYEQAQRERLMMLAWRLGTDLGMSINEIETLIERCNRWPQEKSR